MSYTISDLIYDRTQADVNAYKIIIQHIELGTATADELTEWNSGMKGCVNYTDLNRIGECIALCNTKLSIDLWEKHDFALGEIPLLDHLKWLYVSVHCLYCLIPYDYRKNLGFPDSMLKLDYNGMNQLEKAIYLAYTYAPNMLNKVVYGDFDSDYTTVSVASAITFTTPNTAKFVVGNTPSYSVTYTSIYGQLKYSYILSNVLGADYKTQMVDCNNVINIIIPQEVTGNILIGSAPKTKCLVAENSVNGFGTTTEYFDEMESLYLPNTTGYCLIVADKLKQIYVADGVVNSSGYMANVSTLKRMFFTTGTNMQVINGDAIYNSTTVAKVDTRKRYFYELSLNYTYANGSLGGLNAKILSLSQDLDTRYFSYGSIMYVEQIITNYHKILHDLNPMDRPNLALVDGNPYYVSGSMLVLGLNSGYIPNGVTTIGVCAFAGLTKLTSVEIPDSVTTIRYNAFENCSSLTTITIPDSVTSIGHTTFIRCSSLKTITLPSGITTIESMSFYGCSSLTSIFIPSGVTSIGNNAFADCSALTDVYYGGDATDWSAITIGTGNTYLTNATIHYNATDIE